MLLALGPRVAVAEAQGQDRLLDLELDASVGIGLDERVQEAHAHQLLADGARAGNRLTGLEVLEEGAHDRLEVDARVLPERLVLGGDLGIDHDRRDLLEGYDAPILDREGGELLAVGRHDRRGLVQAEVLDLADVGQVAGEGRVDAHDADEDADRQYPERGEDEARQRGRAGSPARIAPPRASARCGSPARRWTSGHRAAG